MQFYIVPLRNSSHEEFVLDSSYDLPELPISKEDFERVVSEYNPYENVLKRLPKDIGASLSFVKLIEVFNRFNLIEPTKVYRCFFNGCDVDSITALYHWWQMNYPSLELEWYACNDSKTFRDHKKYYEKYPTQWLMNPPVVEGIVLLEESGDMNNEDEIERVAQALGKVQLYISTNIDSKVKGYYSAAVQTLAVKGNLLLRLDSLKDSVEIILNAVRSFEEVHLFKPCTSNIIDEEIYMIALHYTGKESSVAIDLGEVMQKFYGLRLNYTKALIEGLSNKSVPDHRIKEQETTAWLRTYVIRQIDNPL